MDKEEVRAAYIAAVDDGYSHVAVARATGIGVSSLQHFYADDGAFSARAVAKLEPWLRVRGFMDGTWANRDPFGGIIVGLRSLANDIEAESSFDVRRDRLRSFVDLITSHPVVVGLKDTNKTGKE